MSRPSTGRPSRPGTPGSIPAWRWAVAVLLFCCAAGSLYLALTHPEKAGGRGGILVGGLLFFSVGVALLRLGRR